MNVKSWLLSTWGCFDPFRLSETSSSAEKLFFGNINTRFHHICIELCPQPYLPITKGRSITESRDFVLGKQFPQHFQHVRWWPHKKEGTERRCLHLQINYGSRVILSPVSLICYFNFVIFGIVLPSFRFQFLLFRPFFSFSENSRFDFKGKSFETTERHSNHSLLVALLKFLVKFLSLTDFVTNAKS